MLETMDGPSLDRRAFLSLGGGAAAMLCTLNGRPMAKATAADVAESDRLAVGLKRPPGAAVDKLSFPRPAPAPGGTVRTYWIQARSVVWDFAPTGRDDWMGMRVRGRRRFRAFVFQRWSEGFARPVGPARMPGPTLHAEVGDLVEVHFRNADRHFGQAVTMHTHGLRYNPDYDGAYLGDHTRAGGFIRPGDEFVYRWEATPDSVGAWPYHDHGPNHVLNMHRGLFGAIVVRPKGAPIPTREYVLFMHALSPSITGRNDQPQCFNGRAFAGNTPTLRARVGDDVAIHVFGGDDMFHTFHIHGHRWRDTAGVPVDCPTVGPNETHSARFREDNPGRWLYHCHVSSHMMAGMAGWYLVHP
jgi:hypothetical protein